MVKQTAKPYGDAQKQSINIISDGTTIKGDVNASGDIRIDGKLTGNISAKGKLVVGPSGRIEGEINCSNVEVSGFIKGKVTANELLTLKTTSRIEGDIATGKLSVEPGAVFTGTCAMKGAGETDDKQKEKKIG